MEKPSAYRSMRMGKSNSKNRGGLERWIDEVWLNLNALKDKNIELPCGKKYKGQKDPTVCRPKKRINNKTPTPLAYDLSKKQIEKAIKIKKSGKRVSWKDL
jgi:hypothetical protein